MLWFLFLSFTTSSFGTTKKTPADLNHTLSSALLRGPAYVSDQHPAHLVPLTPRREKDQVDIKRLSNSRTMCSA